MWEHFKDWWDNSDDADRQRYIWHMTRHSKRASIIAAVIAAVAYRLDIWADWAAGLAGIVILIDIIWTRLIVLSADQRPENWDKF
ncbi:hypothetical protein [Wielerella bovis]|uniref:hypothetical protein n=1 Tax=Wielerella bovis TaxID=2917790 RepID=UPI002019E413|nr:hypothetical protein [Wielerella bovis]ULJ62922.1 hypothetical protein MIS46_02300 [Wielerella bovis]ULJ65153.1 hypothetical protein MIS33_02350 [Wielerella bovis]ULJ67427.1 hypothetical protein MIS31_02360 [Wielerella bovis]ULJ69732.1 hypothetical protein MIS45_02445 [Wielerella bovis]